MSCRYESEYFTFVIAVSSALSASFRTTGTYCQRALLVSILYTTTQNRACFSRSPGVLTGRFQLRHETCNSAGFKPATPGLIVLRMAGLEPASTQGFVGPAALPLSYIRKLVMSARFELARA